MIPADRIEHNCDNSDEGRFESDLTSLCRASKFIRRVGISEFIPVKVDDVKSHAVFDLTFA